MPRVTSLQRYCPPFMAVTSVVVSNKQGRPVSHILYGSTCLGHSNHVASATKDSAGPRRPRSLSRRRLIFCDGALTLPIDERILECEDCRRFLAYCCSCTESWRAEDARTRYFSTNPNFYKPCHHYKMAFVDGACLGNGQDDATAGIGVAIGAKSLTMQSAIPIDDLIDPPPSVPPSVQSSLPPLMAYANWASMKVLRRTNATPNIRPDSSKKRLGSSHLTPSMSYPA